MSVELLNMDCMDLLRQTPDKYYDLCVVDPPYGIGNWIPSNVARNGKPIEKVKDQKKRFGEVKWNESAPDTDYFAEIERVSKERIIWGANYYNCFSSGGGALVWYKKIGNPNFSQCEIASLSFCKKVDYVHIDWQSGFAREMKETIVHPCQKPVALYEWLLTHYAKPGQRILDTHLGSGSSAIAAHNLGFDFVGTELDPEYHAAAVRRFESHKAQRCLFEPDDYSRVERDVFQESFL